MVFLSLCKSEFLTDVVFLFSEEMSISYKSDLPATDFLSFCLFEKGFIFPSFLKDNFTRYRTLGWFFSVNTWFAWFLKSQINSYFCSSIGIVEFSSGFFQNFLFISDFMQFGYNIFRCRVIIIIFGGTSILFCVLWASWSVVWCLSVIQGKFSAMICFRYFPLFPPFLLLVFPLHKCYSLYSCLTVLGYSVPFFSAFFFSLFFNLRAAIGISSNSGFFSSAISSLLTNTSKAFFISVTVFFFYL